LTLLSISACSKEQNVTTTSAMPEAQEVTEPAKQSTTDADSTQDTTSTQTQDAAVPTDTNDTTTTDIAEIPKDPYIM